MEAKIINLHISLLAPTTARCRFKYILKIDRTYYEVEPIGGGDLNQTKIIGVVPVKDICEVKVPPHLKEIIEIVKEKSYWKAPRF